MKYSGGFAENAYTKSIKLYRVNDGQRLVVDIHSDQFEVFGIKTGDEFMVSYALDRFTNRVIVKGAVLDLELFNWSGTDPTRAFEQG